MVSNTDGNKKPNRLADWKKNKPKTGKIHFKGSATPDSVLYQKVVTNDRNQAGQILALITALFRYVGDKQMVGWAESLCEMERKVQDAFFQRESSRAITVYRVPILEMRSYGIRPRPKLKMNMIWVLSYGKLIKKLG